MTDNRSSAGSAEALAVIFRKIANKYGCAGTETAELISDAFNEAAKELEELQEMDSECLRQKRALSWIENEEPNLVEAAREKFRL